MLNPLRDLSRNAILFLSSVFSTNLGNGLQTITAAYITLRETDSITAVGFLFVIVSLPPIFVSLVAGHFSNQYSKRVICFFCDICSALTVTILALYIMSASNVDVVPVVFAASFTLSLIDAVFNPMSNALLADAVPENEKERVSAVMEAASQAGIFLSAGVGGLIVAMSGPAIGFLINGFTFAVSAFLIISIRYRSAFVTEQNHTYESEFSYAHIIKDVRGLFIPATLFAVGRVVITLSNTLLVVLVIRYHGSGMGVFGITDALAGVGVILASLSYGTIRSKINIRNTIAIGFLTCAFFIILQPQGGSVWLICFLTLGAYCFGIGRIASRALILNVASKNIAGRMFALSNSLGLALSVLAVLASSYIVETTSIEYGFYLLAFLLSCTTIFGIYGMRSMSGDARPGAR